MRDNSAWDIRVTIAGMTAHFFRELSLQGAKIFSMWKDMAACSGMDTDLFFSPDNPGKGTGITGEPERISLAKMICSRCPVRPDCLSFGIETDDRWGILGGLTPQERRRK